LALVDFKMPKMYGHELYDEKEMRKIDGNIILKPFIIY
jgi:FixJ family two-component response regulator